MENNKRRGGMRRKKVCQFCADKTEAIDYKDVEKLKKYVTERGKILPKRITGTCADTSERSNEGNQESKNRSSAALHC